MTWLKDHKQLLSFLLLVIAIDQTSKFGWAAAGSINRGISFSFLSELPDWLLVSLLMLVLLAVWQWGRVVWLKYPFASGLFFGGAVSNLLDRIVFGGVRDFLPLPILVVENNLADYFITVGLIMIVFKEIKQTYD